jgi:hypothetical protein
MALKHAVLAAATTLVVAACSSSTGPQRPAATVAFIAGNNQSDTILGTLAQQLVVRIAIPNGQRASGHTVQFQSLPDTNARLGYQLYLGPAIEPPLLNGGSSPVWDDTTNNFAEASVTVTMGAQVGRVPLVITVPDFGYADTATFTVLVGGAYSVVASPADTTIYIGTSFTYNAGTVDRFGNPRRGDSITYVVDSGPVTITAAGKVTGNAAGYSTVTIIAPKPGLGLNTAVAVVPQGTLAASNATGIVVFHLDGSGMQTVMPGPYAGDVSWDPTGAHLVYDGSAGCDAGTALLHTTDLHGDTTLIANGGDFEGDGNYFDAYPTYSPDGKWIYYTQTEQAGTEMGRVLRVHPDGTGDTIVLANLDYFGSPSPDGTRLLYDEIGEGFVPGLRIMNLSTLAVTSIAISAWSPEWSPTGNAIAYLTPWACTAPIALMNPDGSGMRMLTTTAYHAKFAWSPDGQWIAANNPTTGLIDLINASSGQTIPLPYTTGLAGPAWQPGQSTTATLRHGSPVPGGTVRPRRVQR